MDIKRTKKDVYEFLDWLCAHYNFDIMLKHQSKDEWYNWVAEQYKGSAEERDDYCFDVRCGATKGVILVAGWDFVIKIPFTEYRHYDCNDDVYGNIYHYSPAGDYCKLEWRNYVCALNEGIADYFAETACVGKYHGLPIYVQELLDADEDKISREATEESFRQFCYDNDLDMNNPESLDIFYDESGYDGDVNDFLWNVWADAEKVFDFIDNNHINDLHSGNVCYRGDMVVCCDFSGYGWLPRKEEEAEWYSMLPEVA